MADQRADFSVKVRLRWALLLATTVGSLAWPVAGASLEAPPGASSCSGCHAANATQAAIAVPPLAGRKAADLVTQMQVFKAGALPATVMDRIAKGFNDPEIEAIATWYAQQR